MAGIMGFSSGESKWVDGRGTVGLGAFPGDPPAFPAPKRAGLGEDVPRGVVLPLDDLTGGLPALDGFTAEEFAAPSFSNNACKLETLEEGWERGSEGDLSNCKGVSSKWIILLVSDTWALKGLGIGFESMVFLNLTSLSGFPNVAVVGFWGMMGFSAGLSGMSCLLGMGGFSKIAGGSPARSGGG